MLVKVIDRKSVASYGTEGDAASDHLDGNKFQRGVWEPLALSLCLLGTSRRFRVSSIRAVCRRWLGALHLAVWPHRPTSVRLDCVIAVACLSSIDRSLSVHLLTTSSAVTWAPISL